MVAPPLYLHKPLGRGSLRHRSQYKVFLGRAKGVNVTVPESMHKHSNISPATNSETQEREARLHHKGRVDQLP